MKALRVSLIVAAVVLAVLLGFVYAGIFNVAADEPHWRITHQLIEWTRERSIAARAAGIEVPTLDDAALVAMGAEHYSAMCTGCHLSPGQTDTELRAGLYPKPPNLVEHAAHRSLEQTFWIIKHGLKMTAMPAWGVTHDDRSIWGMVAFLRKLPELSPDAYREMVAQGGSGHSHGEGAHADEERSTSGHSHEQEGATDQEPSQDEDKPKASASGHDHSTHPHDSTTKASRGAGASLPASTTEPIAVIDRFFRGLAAGDTKSASELLDTAVLIYESGGAERSREEYASHHLGSDAAFLKTAKYQLLSRTGDAVGDIAWVATEARLTAQGEKPVNLITTETMVLRKTAQGWRIIHIHWSSRPQAA